MQEEPLYIGKAKSVYATNNPNEVLMVFRDDLTAQNGMKKGSFEGKGAINNQISTILFEKLAQHGIKTHHIQQISDTQSLVQKVAIIPLEVIVRNVSAGSFSKKYGCKEGAPLKSSVLEFSYKNDALNDPMINEYQILALGLSNQQQLDTITEMAFTINQTLQSIFTAIHLKLVDFKLEFGVTLDGAIVLADEITPDTCRLWDMTTNNSFDKDLFRNGLGGYEEAYRAVLGRLSNGKA